MAEIYNLDVILRAKSEGMAAFKEAENGFAGLAKAAAVAGVVLAGAVVVGAIEAYKKTEALGQSAYEMGEKFGLAGGQASAWIAVAQQVGLTSDTVGTAFKFLSKNSEALTLTLEENKKLSAGQLQPYKDLGLNVLDAAGKVKDANELMLEAADSFAKMKDGPEKAGLAVKLFGRSGTDILPILNLGRQGIEDFMASGQKLGTVMSTSQVEAWHKAFLAHKQYDAALEGLTNRIGIAVMPIMARFFDYMVSTGIPAVSRLANWLGPILSAAWNQVAAAAMYFWPTLQQIGEYIRDHVWPAVVQLWSAFSELLAPAIQYIKAHFDDFKVVLIAAAIVVGLLVAGVVIAGVVIVGALIAIIAMALHFYESMKSSFSDAAAAVQNFVIDAVTAWWNFENTIIGGVRRVVTALNQLPGVHIALPNLQGLGGSAIVGGGRTGGVQSFAEGGTVLGPYPGAPMLVQAHVGEEITPAGRGGGAPVIHVHIAGAVFLDNGPSMDRFAMALAQRLSFVTGR